VIFIEVDESFHTLISDEILQNAAQKALQLSQLEDMPSLSIKITGNQEIQELNTSYRGIEKVTDVLSFEADYFDPDLETRYLGDVVISYTQAADQAKKRGHPVVSELQLLVIHGVLHLSGYDHGSAQDREVMWKVQKQALDELGLDIQIEDEDSL
jgi:probable rRNA maturation factor